MCPQWKATIRSTEPAASRRPARRCMPLLPAWERAPSASRPPEIAASAKPTSAIRIPLWWVIASSGTAETLLLLVAAMLPEVPAHGAQHRERDHDRRDHHGR